MHSSERWRNLHGERPAFAAPRAPLETRQVRSEQEDERPSTGERRCLCILVFEWQHRRREGLAGKSAVPPAEGSASRSSPLHPLALPALSLPASPLSTVLLFPPGHRLAFMVSAWAGAALRPRVQGTARARSLAAVAGGCHHQTTAGEPKVKKSSVLVRSVAFACARASSSQAGPSTRLQRDPAGGPATAGAGQVLLFEVLRHALSVALPLPVRVPRRHRPGLRRVCIGIRPECPRPARQGSFEGRAPLLAVAASALGRENKYSDPTGGPRGRGGGWPRQHSRPRTLVLVLGRIPGPFWLSCRWSKRPGLGGPARKPAA